MSKEKDLNGCHILVVDDHKNIRVSLKYTLEAEGARITEAASIVEANKLIKETRGAESFPFHLILLDIRLPDGNGLDILKFMASQDLASRVIMISGEGTVGEAFQATQLGAFDYVDKPFHPERILVSVRRCLDFNDISIAHAALKKQVLREQEIIGEHESVKNVLAMIARVGKTSSRVLITGETGTGKELVAKAIHQASPRANKKLVKVNCAAIPQNLIESELFGHEKGAFTGALKARRGLFEQANGGTLFLDEVGELDANAQAKLLRVLETSELTRLGSESAIKVDVRVLAATHRDLAALVENKEFREDLFYRLNVVSLNVPALRERGNDIALLAERFLEQACHEHAVGNRSFSPGALDQLRSHAWPGNIRELKNVVERVAILSEQYEIDSIEGLETKQRPAVFEELSEPEAQTQRFSLATDVMTWQEFHKTVDKAYITFVLKQAQGNVSEAARLLCLERAYLHRLMKKLGVQRDVVVSD